MTAEQTLMFQEARSSPALVAAQLAANAEAVARLAGSLREKRPRAVITIARGSSDHAATYARYLIETEIGILTASAPPSIGAVYEAELDLDGVLCLAISQSGRSPDLLAAVDAAKAGGARVVALVNAPDSPLAARADSHLPILAGPELSVAATKSFILTLTAIAQLVAAWAADSGLAEAVGTLPEALAAAWDRDWTPASRELAKARNLFVLGRGVGVAIAQEAALKFKETCGLHAEAFSSAEVQHGPMAIVGDGFPVLAFAQNDKTAAGLLGVTETLAARGARVLVAGGEAEGTLALPAAPGHPMTAPVALIQSFYRMAAELAVARGYDPDRPAHLKKVTATL